MFKHFSDLVHAQYERMQQHELFVVDTVDLFETYLAAFPEGSNPIFRERTEHDCSCCKNFIRNIGNVVAIIDGKIVTVWDVAPAYPYTAVSEALAGVVRQAPIRSVWRTKERRYGNPVTYEGERRWDHFGGVVANKHFATDPATVRGRLNTTAQVLKRGLTELTADALDTVIDLIKANNLYRGEEFLPAITAFRQLKSNWDGSDAFIWANLNDPSARFRNTAIGTLLIDLSEGMDLEDAVKKYERVVAPTNYRRPSALITPKMVENALATLDGLGLRDCIDRRHATLGDVSIKDVIFVDNTVTLKDRLADLLAPAPKPANIKNATAISAADFFAMSHKSIQVLVENRHAGNFMSITTGPPGLFQWDNGFSWSYDGDVADSTIKGRVKAAGGNVNAKFRVSLAWFNSDDLDIHAREPDRNHVYFGNKCGVLDVDMNAYGPSSLTPVENLSWPRVKDGVYEIDVVQYSKRNSHNPGFMIEVEINGQVQQFTYPKTVTGTVRAMSITMHNGQIIDLKLGAGLTGGAFSSEIWGIKTETLVPVDTLLLSPNHWGDRPVGNRHWFFILRDCKNPEPVRGIYNEYLRSDLNEHRKVFEVLGSKTKAPPADAQLSGLGFSSTQRNSLKVVADGRAYEVNF